MSGGILQLAAAGKLPLQLEYRTLEVPPEDLIADMGTSRAPDLSSTSLLTGSFELTYGEY